MMSPLNWMRSEESTSPQFLYVLVFMSVILTITTNCKISVSFENIFGLYLNL